MSQDDSGDDGSTDGVSRRRMLQGLSVGAAGALAGCGGDGGGGETTATTAAQTTEQTTTTTATTTAASDTGGDTTTTTTEEEDTTTTTEETTTTQAENLTSAVDSFVIPQSFDAPPPDLHFNTWNQKQAANGPFYDQYSWTHFGLAEGEGIFAPVTCSIAEFKPDTGTIRYQVEDTKWWNPGPRFIDSRDITTMIYSQIGVRNRFVYMNSRAIKQVDERTAVVKQREPQNPGMTRMDALQFRKFHTPWEQWKEWVKKVKSARKADNTWDSQELDAIANQMLNWRQPTPVGSSIFQIDSINPDAFVCSINEGHYKSHLWEGVEEVRVTNQPNKSRRLQQFIEGNSPWWNKNLSEDLQNQVGDDAWQWTVFDSSQTGMGIQHRRNSEKHESPKNKNVPYNVPVLGMNLPWPRIAMEYIIERGKLAKALGKLYISDGPPDDDIITGITAAEDSYIFKDWLDYFPGYPTDKAAGESLLNKVEALSKPQGADWWQYKEQTWEPEFTTQNSGSRLTTGRVVTDQLRQFGIKAKNLVTDSGKLWGDLFANATMGHFPGATYGGWGIYPIEGLEVDGPNSGYGGRFGWHGASNMKGTAKIPPYPDEGGKNAFNKQNLIDMKESDLQTINPPQLAEKAINTTNTETANRLINEMAWMYAFQLPFLPLAMSPKVQWFWTDDYDLVEPYDEVKQWKSVKVKNHRKFGSTQGLWQTGLYHPKRVEE